MSIKTATGFPYTEKGTHSHNFHSPRLMRPCDSFAFVIVEAIRLLRLGHNVLSPPPHYRFDFKAHLPNIRQVEI